MGKSKYEQFRDHLNTLDDADRDVALHSTKGQIYLIVEAISQQARRLRESNSVVHTSHQADAILLVYALRTLLSLGELAVRLVPAREQDNVQAALDSFASCVSDAINARDALAHIDEYLVGFGKQQQKAPAERFLPWFSRWGTNYTVRVGPFAIPVDDAETSAVALATAVLLAERDSASQKDPDDPDELDALVEYASRTALDDPD